MYIGLAVFLSTLSGYKAYSAAATAGTESFAFNVGLAVVSGLAAVMLVVVVGADRIVKAIRENKPAA
jgi:hypothetical protein